MHPRARVMDASENRKIVVMASFMLYVVGGRCQEICVGRDG